MMSAPDLDALRNLAQMGPAGSKTAPDWDEGVVPEDYDAERLDYGYVRTATDLLELKKLLAVLRSGKEGLYPDLERAFKERIVELGGMLKKKPAKASTSAHDQQVVDAELSEWLATMTTSGPKLGAPKPSSSTARARQAETENIKGNESVRARDWTEALACYSRAIDLVSTDAAPAKYFSNRALVHVQLRQYDKAIDDAREGILRAADLPSIQYKCYLRLARAHFFKGQYRDALEAYAECERQGTGTDHVALAKAARDKWQNVDWPAYQAWAERGVRPTARAVPIAVVDDSDDEDDEIGEEEVETAESRAPALVPTAETADSLAPVSGEVDGPAEDAFPAGTAVLSVEPAPPCADESSEPAVMEPEPEPTVEEEEIEELTTPGARRLAEWVSAQQQRTPHAAW
ncbi:hypothetical protein AMAG_02867 [Allomyces macrogynus ATCC 38327]|uniref:Uncharacterized protein n=1 Tax=Allomyces macrogynus (strain ATCC 38327) TaxID=578462 RepID=A0A0L0S3I4_ALLM3|nr:hypothetical protein AMAG_02867 [Allomyces macrogynus ATCC 38327]|eukprot:KNE57117.1 hypothetical protein AMAG_02867 [Allomyces macrogynus ATCC 38327]